MMHSSTILRQMFPPLLLWGLVCAVLALGACAPVQVPAPPPAIVIERAEPAPPPSECIVDGPAFPPLPERDVTEAEAARDRAEIQRRFQTLQGLRAVCRAGLGAGELSPAARGQSS